MQSLKQTLAKPLMTCGVFFILCIIFFQSIIFLLDGAILAYANKLMFNDNISKIGLSNWIVNFGVSLLFLFLYLKSNTSWVQTTFLILAIILLYGFIFFAIVDKFITPNFLFFIIEWLTCGFMLCGFGVLKYKLSKRKA